MSQFQSLYRRFRPQKFSEVRGQDHVVRALQNAVRENHVSHAYLFSGPRGTGKTSSARILAKALNCLSPQDGEPCGVCDSCVAVTQGSSLDVHELDAASNNGVEAMRDLVSRASLGTPGRWKVYIIDEVHMLSTAASNALLKTLEEPPAHVVFVLATTDPQKVLPTIRSRTQHFEFRLLPASVIDELVHDIRAEAHLDVADEALDFVVRRGHGSARDALSLLDQVAASGSAHDTRELLDDIIDGFIENDTSRVLVAVAESIHAGSDARRLTNDIVEHLRNAFLATMSKGLVPLPDEAIDHVAQQANALGAARTVRIMETLGQSLVDMRDSVDPRLTLEIALIRVTTPVANSGSIAELSERIARLEDQLQQQPAPRSVPASESPVAHPPQEIRASTEPRVSLGGLAAQSKKPSSSPSPQSNLQKSHPQQVVAPATTTESGKSAAAELNRDELVKAWGDTLLEGLPQKAKARYRPARFVSVEGADIACALPNEIHRDRCEEVRLDVENAISQHFKTRVRIRLVIEATEPVVEAESAIEEETHEDIGEFSALAKAPDVANSIENRLKEMFPGAEEVS